MVLMCAPEVPKFKSRKHYRSGLLLWWVAVVIILIFVILIIVVAAVVVITLALSS